MDWSRYMISFRRITGRLAVFLIISLLAAGLAGCSSASAKQKLPVRVLILPKFEVDNITGDFPGEAQFFYEEYLAGGQEYLLSGASDQYKLYYKDGVALCITGMGKTEAALSTAAVLSDERFDFSDAYIFSVGCGGSAEGYGIFGDVFVISAVADYDLGHRADPREMGTESETTWFHDESYDGSAVIRLNESLMDQVFALVKDVKLETTEKTVQFLEQEYPGEAWANRPPQVMRGSSVTSDSFWKGKYEHQNALLITETYQLKDPFSISEMEDIAVGQAVRRFGLSDRLIILRVSVNMDVFPKGVTPEMLWGQDNGDELASDDSTESVDIFATAMKNCFVTAKVLIDRLLEGDPFGS